MSVIPDYLEGKKRVDLLLPFYCLLLDHQFQLRLLRLLMAIGFPFTQIVAVVIINDRPFPQQDFVFKLHERVLHIVADAGDQM
ncbi:MAG: hypothetical protein ACJAS3_000370 [Roseivirga sp.]|jgi:hypothetical protein